MKKTIVVSAWGLTPLLIHPITENSARERMVALSAKQSPEELLFRDAEGRLVFPAHWLMQAVCVAAPQFGFRAKHLRRHIIVAGEFIRLTNATGGEPLWETYCHRRHLQKHSRTLGLIRCPQFNDWGFEAEFNFEDPPIAPALLQRLFGVAGREVGIGLFSLAHGGKNSFGRFIAVSWRWKESSQAVFAHNETAKIRGAVICGRFPREACRFSFLRLRLW